MSVNKDAIEFLKSCKFGIVAYVLQENEEFPIRVLHFVGYQLKPTTEMIAHIKTELQTDQEFGLTDTDFDVMEATPAMVRYYKHRLLSH